MIPTTASDYEVNDISWQAETRVHIDQVTIPEDRVGADRYSGRDLHKLVASILANGLIQPITVNAKRELVSGLNRLRAFRHITHTLKIPGYVTIPARTVNADETTQVIVEVHENTVRRELADKDARAMVERARAAGMSRAAAVKHVAELTGQVPSTLEEGVRIDELAADVDAAMRSGKPTEVEAAKRVSRLLADRQSEEALMEGRRIMAAARAGTTTGPMERQTGANDGATVTNLTARQNAPASTSPSTVKPPAGEVAWKRHFLLIAQEAAALEAMDVSEAACVFAALPENFQARVRATVETLAGVLQIEVATAA